MYEAILGSLASYPGEAVAQAESESDSVLTLLVPNEAGLLSEGRKVAARVATLLESLATLEWVAEGVLRDYLRAVRSRIYIALEAEGWRVERVGNKLRVRLPDRYNERRPKEAPRGSFQ